MSNACDIVTAMQVWYYYRDRARQNPGASASGEISPSNPLISPQEVTSPRLASQPSDDAAHSPYHDAAHSHHNPECCAPPLKQKQMGASVLRGLKSLRLRRKRSSASDVARTSAARPVAESKDPVISPSKCSSWKAWLVRQHSRQGQDCQDSGNADTMLLHSPHASFAVEDIHDSAGAHPRAPRREDICGHF